jgi:uncharacterized SAM-binding protein YcdF (DUF218 family)
VLVIFYDIFTAFIEIPGIFISLCIIFLIIFLIRRKKLSIPLLTVCIVIYVFSSGWFAKIMVLPLENRYPSVDVSQLDDTQEKGVIVVLGGGIIPETPREGSGELSDSAMKRVYEGFLLYKKLQFPIVVTGGKLLGTEIPEAQIMKEELLKMGVKPNDIYVEPLAKNTKQNAEFTLKLLETDEVQKIYLVTSAIHLTRAMNYFESYTNINIVPVPTDYKISREELKWYDFLPDMRFLEATSSAWHEYLGLVKFKISG